jgi:outer membrane protein assembly factor BamB
VVGNNVYLATADDTNQRQSIMSFDRQTGSPNWTTVVHEGGFPSARQVHKKGTNANGTIASDGNRLYASFLNREAINATALDLDGQIVWQQELGKFVSKFGYAPSPILYKSLVIFAADNRGGGYLAALDTGSGKIAWRIKRGTVDTYSSPIVANVGGRDQLLISGCDAVTSYDPATGSQNWRTPCIAQATCGTIVTTNDRILASGGYPERETVCLAADGERIWSNDVKAYEPSMLVVGDRLVAVNDDGIAYCWSIKDGQPHWRERLGGNFSASPVLVGDLIYVSNLKGETFVFRAGDEYRQIAKNRLGNDCYASPAVSDGELFLRVGYGSGTDRQEQLVCIAGDD